MSISVTIKLASVEQKMRFKSLLAAEGHTIQSFLEPVVEKFIEDKSSHPGGIRGGNRAAREGKPRDSKSDKNTKSGRVGVDGRKSLAPGARAF